MTPAAAVVADSRHRFFPREHGALAMLLTPFCAAAVLARVVRWQEAAALAAVVGVFAAQDPLVFLARQRWVWKQRHAETPAAMRWIATELAAIAACGVALLTTGPWAKYMMLFGGAAVFSALAVWVNVHNLQRGVGFQVASAVALTSTSLTAVLAAAGSIPGWCWWLWGLMAVQSAAGIFTVHARLEARVAARVTTKNARADATSLRPAIFFSALLGAAGIAAATAGAGWVGAALLLAAAGYGAELARQRNTASLRMPMASVGVQMLTLGLAYSAMVVRGLW